MRRLLRVSLLVPLLGISVLAAAATPSDTTAQLAKLKQQIAQLEQQIDAELGDRQSLQRTLRDNDKEIAELTLREKDLQARIRSLKGRAGDLNGRRLELQKQIALSREQMQQLLVEQYKQGQEPRLKLLLSNRSPADLDRMMRYYAGISDALKSQVEAFNLSLESLASTNQAIDDNEAELNSEAKLLVEQKQAIESAKIKRLKTLARINASIDEKRDRVSELNTDVKRLQNLLEDINRSVDLLALESETSPFAANRGKLGWPVSGKVIQRFGSERSRDGMVIAVDAGNPVYAIHPGRVVFSEWLRGYGLLIIIDHGQGYMSLYGHNQSLRRQTGDWVAAGDSIAVSGSSGGYDRPALYFSIRHKAQSVDPLKWLKRS